ncbi:LysR family transcriptional regulator [Pseudonocardia benzenivorans]|uniref:Transcriptional regulator, LysR family n=2 Tax=Pseudonocardia TaxID=1847 RepID=F4CP95_PSEUX|nr:LysR family transcriptional regulator [Pseudonocardia dioxanivorans]AEA23654.1 transcriptional regulator, LysR family [Pseudonocardia dioxanivorans CB1190]GJF06033.1 LysR family transcriptional regulator [Pseudonocardia sp. D17]
MTSSSSRLARLDLNLLVVLRELLRERNVTRAAARVGVSQPAASAALGRLRRHFDDELLVRRGAGYELSALAHQLVDQVETVCDGIDRLLSTGADFDPATSHHEFTIVMSDYAIAVMGERLAAEAHARAPHVRLNVVLVREALAAGIDRTIRAVDAVVSSATGRFRQPEIRSTLLFRDRWVVVVGRDTVVGDPLTLHDLRDATWVVPYHRDSEFPSVVPVSGQLAALGLRPTVTVRVDSYVAVPFLVASSGHVALMQETMARTMQERLGLRILDPPAPLEPFVERLWWHERLTTDPAHRWFRRIVERAARAL